MPVEPLIYVQTTPDDPWITDEIARIGAQTGQGKELRMLLDNGWGDGEHEAVSWPFEWYLRDYTNRRYFTRTIDPNLNLADYPVLLARSTNLEPIQQQLANYTCQQYRAERLVPRGLQAVCRPRAGAVVLALPHRDSVVSASIRSAQTLSNPDNRLKLLKFLIYREAPGDTGARDMHFCVHRDVPALGPAPLGGPPARQPAAAAVAPAQQQAAVQAPRDTVLQPQSDGSVVYGRTADGRPMLTDPKNVALGPDGRIYAVEGRAARVTVFNADGSVATTWGTAGRRRWPVPRAVGHHRRAERPRVRRRYLESPHSVLRRERRVPRQVRSPGRLERSINAEEGAFWGPRAVAVSRAGEVYVTDTGNKRVQVFDLQGQLQAHVRRRGQRARPVPRTGRHRARRAGERLDRRHVERPRPEARPERSTVVPVPGPGRLGEPAGE